MNSTGELGDSNRATAILRWLKSQGYPTELRVGSALAATDLFFVEHGVLFDDPLEGKVREIDLVARASASEAKSGAEEYELGAAVTVNLIIECKSNVDAWIGFTSLRTLPARSDLTAFRSQLLEPVLIGSVDGSEFLSCIAESEVLDPDLIALGVVSYDSRSVGKPRNDERNVAHFGLVSAFNATLAIEAKDARAQAYERKPIPIYLPTVVIDGELWEYRFAGGDDFSLKEARWLSTRVNHAVWEGSSLHEMLVTVIAEKHLSEYVACVEASLKCLANSLAPLNEMLWTAFHQRGQSPTKRGRGPFPRLQP